MTAVRRRLPCALVVVVAACGGHGVAVEDAGTTVVVVPHGDAAMPMTRPDAVVATDVQVGTEAAVPVDSGPVIPGTYCALGHDVAGATLPADYCLRAFATIGSPRVMSAAPNGDLFVSAPSDFAPGGSGGGPGAIVVLSDDDHDGTAEQHTFLAGSLPDASGATGQTLAKVHGIAVHGAFVYFTTEAAVWRVAYTPGQRAANTTPEWLGSWATSADSRWTHGVSVSASGVVYATQGVFSGLTCPDTPRNGNVKRADANGVLTTVSEGFRNPMYTRCHPTAELCMAAELGDDGGASYGARERLVTVQDGANFGYPCCATTGIDSSYSRDPGTAFSCASVPREAASFRLNDTPFGFDWEHGTWSGEFGGAMFAALHGSFYSVPQWAGAGVVYAPTDPATHLPTRDFQPFLTGFGHDSPALRRPADVVFGIDGRMFVADDQGNAVYWIAPRTLAVSH